MAGASLSCVLVLVLVVPRVQDVRHGTGAELESLSSGANFKGLYKEGKQIDMDHPNRIDKYGCLFDGCGAEGSLSKKGAAEQCRQRDKWGGH